MKSEAKLEQKRKHDAIMEIKRKVAKGLPTTFAERNILTIHNKKQKSCK
jgi:hypothetical protein